MNPDQPFSHALAPCKTLWFEFLLTPDLLHKHLNQKNPDPNPIELIINFLNNINNGSINTSTNNDENTSINNQLNQENSNSNSIDISINSNSKKYLGIKLLALKVAAFLNYDLDTLEQNLPITMQFTLLNELIKICDNNTNNNSSCSLFAYINYYRWILRSVIKLSYPSRNYSLPVPVLQQIDPCYLPHETIANWFDRLKELSITAINGLEKVIKENEIKEITNILMPNFDFFKSFDKDKDLNEFNFCWQNVTELNTNEIMDTIKYELGKWFFFNENYQKASIYFNKINLNKINKLKFKELEELKRSSNDMLIDNLSDDLNDDLNLINIDDCLDLIRFEHKKEQTKLFKELKNKFNQIKDNDNLINLKLFCYYLSLKLPNCLNEFKKYTIDLDDDDNNRMNEKLITINNDNNLIFRNDQEFKLIEATEPELILDLINKINKQSNEINNRWELPKIYLLCLKSEHNVRELTQEQQTKCFLILVKAFELRNAKLYTESRILFLSLLEDVQANMKHLAELIEYEILLTDLQIQIDLIDKDERLISKLIPKCENILKNEEKKKIFELLPQLVLHCCIFLLEYDVLILKDYLQSTNQLIKLTSCLFSIKKLQINQTNSTITILWEIILNIFRQFDNNKQINQINKKRKLDHQNKLEQNKKLTNLTIESLILLINNLKSLDYIIILTSCFARIHNLIKDNQGIELSSISTIQWPNTIGLNTIDLNQISSILKLLINKAIKQTPNDLIFLKLKAELALVENQFHESLRNFIKILIITTDYFKIFKSYENESIIQKMIICSIKLGCYTQAAVLHQMTKEINYQLVFKALNEKICYDSCDDLYDCIWDLTILEFLVNMHFKKGEIDRKTKVIRIIGQLELNANNSDDIRKEASNIRRGKFFRYMAKKYL